MSSPSQFEILTSEDTEVSSNPRSFDLFPRLPTELRLKIWHHALERRRIIKVDLWDRGSVEAFAGQQAGSTNSLRDPNTLKDQHYNVVVGGYQTFSKLFRVSRESRDAAMGFYRVHLPCWLTNGATKSIILKPGTLFFNPEYDILHIDTNEDEVVDFLHYLKTAHDPRHVGLRNLAISPEGIFHDISPPDLNPLFRASFVDILWQLHEVYFVHLQAINRYRSTRLKDADQRFRSSPIAPMALQFDRVEPDPRPIGEDFKLFNNLDPSGPVHEWHTFFDDYFGGRLPQAEYRVLCAYAVNITQVYTRQDAEEFLQWEIKSSRAPDRVPTAFGFWLFPLKNFDLSLGDEQEGPQESEEQWPGLALTKLP
ncbi:hypothetical protein M426DRAFT_316507 [Hypoxylon sp. CI-4A]|nr:hypothetical protein M426DRAFT_316507 [Hypoxylon sp. CI-4A]